MRTGRQSSPDHVARRFLDGWLGCTYHQTPCSQITGMLPAYAVALDRQQGDSRATPAELSAPPLVVSLQLLRSCRRAAVAIATYKDRESDRFELHVNLIHDASGWHVFDVAEGPPHIALPEPLTHGPHEC